MGKPATQEEKDGMVALYLGGAKAEDAAKTFGFVKGVCLRALKQRGIKPSSKGRRPEVAPGSRSAIPSGIRDAVLRDYEAGFSASEAGRRNGVDKYAACNILKWSGVECRPGSEYIKVFSDKQEQEIVSRYEAGESCPNIAADLEQDYRMVWSVLKRRGVETRSNADYRTHSLDRRFFQDIDTEEKAYWLGFLAADGCSTGNSVRIELAAIDREHLEKFAKSLGASAPVVTSRKAGVFPSGRNYDGEYSRIQIGCKQMTEDLAQWGIVPRKSLVIRPWSGPAHLIPHYWRGLIDGDGTVSHYANEGIVGGKQWMISLVGSEWVVKGFAEWANSVCGTRAKAAPRGNIWGVTIGGLAICQKLARALYGNSTVALARKNLKAKELVEAECGHDFIAAFLPKADNGLYIKVCPGCGAKRHERHANGRRYEGRCPACRKGNRNDIDALAVRLEYEAGASTVMLARKYKSTDGTIARKVREAGGSIRSQGDAQRVAARIK